MLRFQLDNTLTIKLFWPTTTATGISQRLNKLLDRGDTSELGTFQKRPLNNRGINSGFPVSTTDIVCHL